MSLCRLRPPGDASLAPYERRILSYLDALATGDVVPAPALAEGETRPAAWWRKPATLGSRGIVGGTIVAALLGIALARRLNTDRLTAAGAAAAGRWSASAPTWPLTRPSPASRPRP